MFYTFQANLPREINTTITEHRAPTDESIRLFHEMREKAIASVVDAGREQGGDILRWALMDRQETRSKELHLVVTVNGKESRSTAVFDDCTMSHHRGSDLVQAVNDRVGDAIKAVVIEAISKGLFKEANHQITRALLQ